MLGKLIKNEFVQRGQAVLAILLGALALGGVVGIIQMLYDNTEFPSETFAIIHGVAVAIFVISLIAAAAGLVIISVGDFGKRLFKEQGYLTHTLPAKTSKIVFSRMFFDIVFIVGVFVVFPIAISFAANDFSFFEVLSEVIAEIFDYSGAAVTKALITANMLMSFVFILMSILFSIWQINVSYAFGHMFNKGKKVISIVAYIVLNIILSIIVEVISEIFESVGFVDYMYETFDMTEAGYMGTYFMTMFAGTAIMLAGTVIFGAITTYICKNKLNIE